MHHKVSIITPLFNRGHIVSETLDSVLAQSHENWIHIIVDDGSTDDGPEIVKKYAAKDERFVFLERKELPKGASHCRNIGAEYSDADFLIFLDSDDLLHPECLKNRINHFKTNPDLDFLVFPMKRFVQVPEDRNFIFNRYKSSNFEYFLSFLRDQTPWGTPCPIWKKEKFLEIGGFNENYLRLTDPVLHTNAILQKLKFKVLKDSFADIYYRTSETENIENFNFWEDSLVYRVKFIPEIFDKIHTASFSPNEMKQCKNALAFFIRKLFKNLLIRYIDDYTEMIRVFYSFIKNNNLVKKRTQYLLKLLLITTRFPKLSKTLKLRAFIHKSITV